MLQWETIYLLQLIIVCIIDSYALVDSRNVAFYEFLNALKNV